MLALLLWWRRDRHCGYELSETENMYAGTMMELLNSVHPMTTISYKKYKSQIMCFESFLLIVVVVESEFFVYVSFHSPEEQ
jgi:hypothetical protein